LYHHLEKESESEESKKKICKEMLKEMNKVGASLVRILRELIHFDKGYIIKVYCM
jgi:hypothetical protein